MPEASDRDPLTKRAKMTSVIFSVPRRIHSHVSRRTTSELYGVAKTTIVVMTVALPTVIGFVIVMQAMLHTPVIITPIRVPDSYEKSGYSSEAATQRLLDEIANLNNISLGGKPKTDVGDTNFLSEVASTQIQSGLIDARSIQTLIRRFFGRDIIQLSGEITLRKQGEEEISRLRLRRSPGRETLIDVESTEGPDGLFVKGAMNLLERIDPEIAAGIYWREYRDAEAARRLLSVALTSSDPIIRKFSYNLKSFMLAADGRIDEALAASERVRSFGGDEFPADNSKAFALLSAKKFDDALALQLQNVDRFPKEQSTSFILGMIYQALGRDAEAIACFRRTIELDPRNSGVYQRLAIALRATGDMEGATEALLTGMSRIPNSPGLLYEYAEDLRRRNEMHTAVLSIRKAAIMNPDNWAILVSLAEIEYALGHAPEAARATNVIRSRLANDEKPPARLRDRIDAILKSSPKNQ
jgi:tetratricopeptide (TPR) repeat protein